MKRTVRVIVRDYPKRSQQFRSTVDVDAETDDEAMQAAVPAARLLWPHGKITAYDVAKVMHDPIPAAAFNAQHEGYEGLVGCTSVEVIKPPRQTLKAKTA